MKLSVNAVTETRLGSLRSNDSLLPLYLILWSYLLLSPNLLSLSSPHLFLSTHTLIVYPTLPTPPPFPFSFLPKPQSTTLSSPIPSHPITKPLPPPQKTASLQYPSPARPKHSLDPPYPFKLSRLMTTKEKKERKNKEKGRDIRRTGDTDADILLVI